MKKILLLLISSIILSSCVSTIAHIKSDDLKQKSYSSVLLVGEAFYSNKSGFSQLFNSKTQTYKSVDNSNTMVLNKLSQMLKNDQINCNIVRIDQNIDKEEIGLNENTPSTLAEKKIEQSIEAFNSDLLIKLQIEDIVTNYTQQNYNMQNTASGARSKQVDIIYLFTAVDVETRKEVWKIKIDSKGINSIIFNNSSKTAKKVYSQIQEDFVFKR